MNEHASLNKFFRIVWNAARGAWVAVAEIARGQGKGGARRSARRAALRALGVAVAGLQGHAFAANGAPPAPTQLPTGGQVVAGQATLKQSGATLTVSQSTQRAAIDWQTFDLGSQARIDFAQPGTSSVTLNRVLDTNASQIFGRISAPGQVFIVNPNGVLFGATAQVDVGGLVASTLAISNADFMAGRTTFGADGASTGGTVDNQGRLTARNGGYIALLAPEVRNEGVIAATEGTAALAAGDQVTLQFGGARPIAVQVDRAALNALVDNRHAIRADGGLVLLAAGSANALLDTVIGNSGTIRADTLASHDGRIVLEGGAAGVVSLGGSVQARGLGDGQVGGTIIATGDKVLVPAGTLVDARGSAGGGTIDIGGGGWHGSDATIPQATATIVEAGATLDASATANGNGGTVEVWSDINNPVSATRAWGSFLANAGPQGGNGGRIETSGHWLDTTGARGGAAAPRGVAGTWLFDPYDVTISASGSSNVDDSVGGGTSTWTPLASGSNIQNTDIQAHLEGGTNVTITTGTSGAELGDITVSASITKTAGATDVTLTLKAANTIDIEAPISNTGGGGKLHVALAADDDNGVHDGNGAIILNADITTGGGSLSFGTGATMAINGVTTQVGGDVYIGGTGGRTLSTGGGNITINGEMLIANTGGLDVETAGGDVLFGGIVNSGNSYSFVNTPLQWNQAMLAAQAGAGANTGDTYLTTITSRLENAIASRAANYQDSWLGAHRGPTDGTTTTTDANWRWVSGPEGLADGGKGTIFFTQTGNGTGTTVPGYFTNWNPGEPNNSGGGTNYANNGESAIQFTGRSGAWNDLPDGIGNFAGGLPYSVETNLAPSALTVHAASGTVTFAGAVGTLKPLASVEVDAGAVVLTGGAVVSTGSQLWQAPITGANGIALSGSDLNLQGAITATAGNVALTATAGNILLISPLTATSGDVAITSSGGGLAYSGNIELDGANPTLTITQDSYTTFGGTISGANAQLVKAGTGTLGLLANNTYGGGTTLAGGELELDSDGAVGSTGTISFTGGTLRFNGFTSTDLSPRFSNAPGQLYSFDTANQDVEFDADLTSVGGTLTKLGNRAITLIGTNTYDGGTILDAGALFGGGASMARTAFGTGSITVNPGGYLWSDRSQLANDLVLNGGQVIGSNGFGELWSGHVTVNANSTINAQYYTTFSGPITGPGDLTMVSSRYLVIAGADTSTGTLHVQTGTLMIGSGGSTGSIAGPIDDASAVMFNRSDAAGVYAGTISGAGTVEQAGSGRFTLTGTNTYTGATTISNGTLDFRNDTPSFTTSGVSGPGSLVIEPASASFAAPYTFALANSGLGGLTIGKPGSTADLFTGSPISVAGPIALYGGTVTLDTNITSTGIDAPFTVQATRDIVQRQFVQVTTAGGDVLYQSDATDDGAGGFIWLRGAAHAPGITTNGGAITLSGGSDPTTGFARGRATGTGSLPDGNGVTLDDAQLSSGGGAITIRGTSTSGTPAAIATSEGAQTNADGVRTYGATHIDAGTGPISITGLAQGLGSSNGIELSQDGLALLTSSNSGDRAISLNGQSFNPSATDSFGVYTWSSQIVGTQGAGITILGGGRDGGVVVASGGSVLSDSGPISLIATSGGGLQVAGTVGQKAASTVPTSTSNITLAGDTMSVTGTVQSTGLLLLDPFSTTTTIGLAGGTGSLQIPAAWFGTVFPAGFSGVVVGATNNSGAMDVGALTLNAPLTLVNGTGDITIDGALNVGTNDMLITSHGSVTSSYTNSAITAATLVLRGDALGDFNISGPHNAIGTLDAQGHVIIVVDAGAMTISGITAAGSVAAATYAGDLTVAGNVTTTGTLLLLDAGVLVPAGTATGGNVLLSGSPTIAVGSGGMATVFTGSVAGSTDVAALAGAGNFRYGSSLLQTNYTQALGAGFSVVYREAPTVTVTATGATKTYDGIAFSGGNGYTATGTINGDDVAAATSGSATWSGSSQGALNAGTYAITPGSLTSALGYNLAYADGTLTVGRKAVTVSADKVYDGSTSLAGAVTIATGIAGETLGYTGATANDAHVATSGKFIDSLALADGTGLAGNYVLPTLDAANAPVTITQRAIGATAGITGALTKTYDGSNAATGAHVGGIVINAAAGDTLTLDASGVSLAYNGTHVVGTNAIVATGSAGYTIASSTDGSVASDYSFTAPTIANATASITPKALTSTAAIGGTLTKTYDGTAAATGATVSGGVNGAISGDTLTLDTSGVSLAYNGTHVVGTNAVVASGSGTLTIASSTDGSVASDYSFTAPTIANATASITPKALTSTAAIGGTLTKIYDGTAAATGATVGGSVSGAVSGDTLALDTSAVSLAYNGTHVVGTNAVVATGAGTFAIASSTDGSAASDYSFTAPTIANAGASITPKTLTSTATIGGTLTKTYDGTAAATGASVSGGVNGAISGDTLALDTSGVSLAYNGTHVVGTNVVVASGSGMFTIARSADGSVASDYTFTAPTIANATASITPRGITVTAPAASKIEDGTTKAAGTASVGGSGLAGSDSLAGVTLTFDTAAIGTGKTVTPSQAEFGVGTLASDYAVTYGINIGGVIAPALAVDAFTAIPRLVFASVDANAVAPRIEIGSRAVAVDMSATQLTVLAAPSASGDGAIAVAVDLAQASSGLQFQLPAGWSTPAATATVANGAALPAWLHFDAATGRFSAATVPVDALPLEVIVTLGTRHERVMLGAQR